MTSIETDFAEALRLRDRGDESGAMSRLSRWVNSPDATAAVLAVFGHLQWETGDLAGAVSSFQKATTKSRCSEVASLGLFHSLMESQREDEAFAEMKRYLSVAESPEYQRLLTDILQSTEDESFDQRTASGGHVS